MDTNRGRAVGCAGIGRRGRGACGMPAPGRAHRGGVARGVWHARGVVAPSVWMLDAIRACYARPRRDSVIYNGRNPASFNPYVSKDDSVLSVGRLCDAGKQVNLLTQYTHPLPVCIVGAELAVADAKIPIR